MIYNPGDYQVLIKYHSTQNAGKPQDLCCYTGRNRTGEIPVNLLIVSHNRVITHQIKLLNWILFQALGNHPSSHVLI